MAVWSARNVIGCSPVLVQESTGKKKGRKCCTFSTVGSVNVFCCVVSGVNCVGGGRSASICLWWCWWWCVERGRICRHQWGELKVMNSASEWVKE